MKKLIASLVFGLCVIASVILISCSRPADKLREETVPVGEHVFTTEEVQVMLFTNGIIRGFTLTDAQYVAPTLEWVEKQYAEKLNKFLFDFNLRHWTKESSDCDDISRAAAVNAAILFHNSKNRPKGAGFLFGEYHYVKSGLGGHAINIAIVKDKDIYKVVYFDPQFRFLVSLQEKETDNTLWGRF